MPEPWSRAKLAAVTIRTRRRPFGSFWYRATFRASGAGRLDQATPILSRPPAAMARQVGGRRLRSRRTGRIPGLPRFRRRPGPRRCRCRARPGCGAPARPGPARCRCWPPGRPGGQQRDLVTTPGTGPEDLFGACQAQRRDDRSRWRRPGGHLMAGDWGWARHHRPWWRSRPARTPPRGAPDRVQHAQIGDPDGADSHDQILRAGLPAVTLHRFPRLDKGLRGDLPSPALPGSGPRGRHSTSQPSGFSAFPPRTRFPWAVRAVQLPLSPRRRSEYARQRQGWLETMVPAGGAERL